MPVDAEDLRRIYLALPGVEQSTHHGTMSFVVRKTFLGRLRDDDTVFAVRISMDERDFLIEIEPEIFFTTDHYRGYGYVLVRLGATTIERLAPLIERSWRGAAPKRLVAALDDQRRSP